MRFTAIKNTCKCMGPVICNQLITGLGGGAYFYFDVRDYGNVKEHCCKILDSPANCKTLALNISFAAHGTRGLKKVPVHIKLFPSVCDINLFLNVKFVYFLQILRAKHFIVAVD